MPGLADRPSAADLLLPVLESLLSPLARPLPPEPAARRRLARCIAGILLAVGQAEAEGAWPRLGTVAGGARGRLRLGAEEARTRWGEVLAAAGSGTEVVITRRGRPSVRLVGG